MATMQQEWQAGDPEQPKAHVAVEQLGQLEGLDGPAEKLAGVYSSAVGPGALKDALSGTWLGHALHPLLTDAVIAFWLSATTLDYLAGEESEPAADKLVGLGILSALPTALTGLNDWADTVKADPRARRVGLVHAWANSAGLTLYGASLLARRSGARGLGKLLGLGGLGAVGFGGLLGGHLSYSYGVGVDQTTFEQRTEEWTRALAADELADGTATAVDVAGEEVMLTRQGDRVYALANRCCHRGGPLHKGAIEDGCVECPWHKSVFRLEDGSVERGPAAYPQPAYDVRIDGGEILVRSRA